MKYDRAANVAPILAAAFAAVVVVVRLGQVLIFRTVVWQHSADPMSELGRVGHVLDLIVYPLAALIGGTFVATARLGWRASVIACALVLVPLWAARFAPTEVTTLNVAGAAGLFALALAPRAITIVASR
jgi:hypothetical protein